MVEMRQGKCVECRVAFTWPATLMPLKNAYCPQCGAKLHQTTHLLQWTWKLDTRPYTYGQAYHLRKREAPKPKQRRTS